METACLRIKFTPLIKESQKYNSKCCLEIVPEVSHIQNLEKLSWKNQDNCIEYTVPMTYKIILRKQNTVSNKHEGTIRSYYSCVDLFMATSHSNCDLSRGDESRIISDTFIFSKLPPNESKRHDIINTLIGDANDVTQSGTATYETVTTIDLQNMLDDENKEEIMNKDKTETISQQCYMEDVEMIVCDKNINTNNIGTNTYDAQPDHTSNKKTGPESKRMMSVSPRILRNSQGTLHTLYRNTVSKSIACNINDIKRDFVLLNSINALNPFSKGIQLSNMVSKFNGIARNPLNGLFCTPTYKCAPQKRISRFVEYMELELSPLHSILDNIIAKCTVLGVDISRQTSAKPSSSDILLDKYVSDSNRQDSVTEMCTKSVSNRAVFSIVSDD